MATVTEVNVQTGVISQREMTADELASYVKPTDDDLKQECKDKAKSLLASTDWTEIPSVLKVSNSPYLANPEDFIAYRNALRELAVNPVVDPTWPNKPSEQWN